MRIATDLPDVPETFAFNVQPLKHQHNVMSSAQPSQLFTRDDMSEDQQHVYDAIMAWESDPNARQYLKVGGYAGTGKTTTISAVARMFEYDKGLKVAYSAFTGKAVNVMTRKLRAAGVYGQSGTLHSLMYRPETDPKGNITGWTKVPALDFDLVVVDEASMIGSEIWSDLLSYGLPILAVGDHGQLPPVGDAVVNLMLNPDLRLERIHRQAEGNPILAFAQHARDGKSYGSFEPTDNRVSYIRAVADIAGHIAEDPNNRVAICYTNRTRVSLNNFIRRAQHQLLMVPDKNGPFPAVGDTVVCLRNKKPIFNGMRGVVTLMDLSLDKFRNSGAVIDFVDDNLRLTSKLHIPQFNTPKTFDSVDQIVDAEGNQAHSWNAAGMLFDYGYALTCHKAQGSQFKEVVVLYENLFRDADTRKRWLYTAGTRAAERLYLVKG